MYINSKAMGNKSEPPQARSVSITSLSLLWFVSEAKLGLVSRCYIIEIIFSPIVLH